MATLTQIRDRILTRYQALPTQKEKLEFLYQVQERLRTFHNTRGAQFEAGQITQAQWDTFRSQWMRVSERVSERIAILRERVFTEDYQLIKPTSGADGERAVLCGNKREELKAKTSFNGDIDTIWQ